MNGTHLDPSTGGGRPREGVSAGRLLLLILLAAIILYLLQAIGLPVVYRTDSTEILSHPHR